MSSLIQLYAPEHPIKSVTVFKSRRAEVVRTFNVELEAGQTKIEITGLSGSIDTDSVRVTGLGSSSLGSGGGLRLYDVVSTVSSKDPSPSTTTNDKQPITDLSTLPTASTPEETIRLLNCHLNTLDSQKRIREHEQQLLVSYANTLKGDHVSPPQMTGESGFLADFVRVGKNSLAAVQEISEQIVQVKRKIEEEEEKRKKKKGSARGRVEVVLGNESSQVGRKVELKLTYIVSNVSWDATYELHATTNPITGQPKPHITLYYRARITQCTGEDWTDAALTLSTFDFESSHFSGFDKPLSQFAKYPAFRTTMPVLSGVKIRPAGQQRQSLFGNTGNLPQAFSNFSISNNVPAANIPRFGATMNTSGAGQPATNSATTGFGLFGNPGPSQGVATSLDAGVLFGGRNTQVAPGGSTFGASAPASTGGGPGISVFGGFGSSSTPAPASTGGLFGSATQSAQQAPQAATFGTSSGNGLFGSANSNYTPTFEDEYEEIVLPQSSDDLHSKNDGAGAGDDEGGKETLTQTQTTVTETPLAVAFSVEGRATIPSDGIAHHVGVAVLEFGKEKEGGKNEDVVIEYGIVPRVDKRVYLRCQIKNTSEYMLLPGPVSVILDDSSIARTFIEHVNTNELFTCFLGTDPSATVTYTRTSRLTRSAGGAFAEHKNLTTYTTKTTIWNRHASFDLKDMRVWDAVPMWSPIVPFGGTVSEAEKDKVRVVLRKPAGLADADEGQVVKVRRDEDQGSGSGSGNVRVRWEKEKEGKLEWRVDVPAGKKETLVLEWEVRAPADMTLVETVVGPFEKK